MEVHGSILMGKFNDVHKCMQNQTLGMQNVAK